MSEERFFGRKIVKNGEYSKAFVLDADREGDEDIQFVIVYYQLKGREPLEWIVSSPEETIENKYQFDAWIMPKISNFVNNMGIKPKSLQISEDAVRALDWMRYLKKRKHFNVKNIDLFE